MSEMVERLARVLCIQRGGGDPEGRNWQNAPPHWHGYVADARELIEAMREPTEAMLVNAGKDPAGVSPRGGVDYLGRMLPKYWRAMISAALKDSPLAP